MHKIFQSVFQHSVIRLQFIFPSMMLFFVNAWNIHTEVTHGGRYREKYMWPTYVYYLIKSNECFEMRIHKLQWDLKYTGGFLNLIWLITLILNEHWLSILQSDTDVYLTKSHSDQQHSLYGLLVQVRWNTHAFNHMRSFVYTWFHDSMPNHPQWMPNTGSRVSSPCLFSLRAYFIFSISTNYQHLWSKATVNLWGMEGLFQQSTQRSTGRSIDQHISFQCNCSFKCIHAPKCNYSRYSHSGASKQHEEL